MKLRHAQKNAEQIDSIKSDLLIYNNWLRKFLTINDHIIRHLEETSIRNEQIRLIGNKQIMLVITKMCDHKYSWPIKDWIWSIGTDCETK